FYQMKKVIIYYRQLLIRKKSWPVLSVVFRNTLLIRHIKYHSPHLKTAEYLKNTDIPRFILYLSLLSKMIVTGPAFVKVTSIIPPNSPVSTCTPFSRTCALKLSYNSFALSGFAACTKLGRRPFFVS